MNIIFAVLAIALLFWLVRIFVVGARSRKRASSAHRRSAVTGTGGPAEDVSKRHDALPRGQYHAVSVYAAGGCAAARAVSGQRYLSSEAPQLPLPGCDAVRCKCRYLHHVDRRSGEDRRALSGIKNDLHPGATEHDKRQSRGRRSGDWAIA